MRIALIRHGESQANTGATRHHDSCLTDRGHEQMRATAQELAKSVKDAASWAGFVSPYLRTMESAEPIRQALGVSFAVDWRLREYCGPAGVRDDTKMILNRSTQRYPSEPWYEVPEDTASLAARCRDFLAAIKDQTHVIVVAHGSPVLMLATLLGSPDAQYPGWRDQIANASITWFSG